MTTYEFKSGLRLALMKLENSISLQNGLPLNEIVDLRRPEERMAARLVARLNITPPIDVEHLCRSFAELSFKQFPIEIDGICLDLKVPGKKPRVWVSMDIAPVRQRFTLAHEIGHIVIPWHTGSIIDDIEMPSSTEQSQYREMEAEANRFAAELLMPSAWVAGLSERSNHVAGLMHSVREIAQVSYHAAFLKAAKLGRPGYVGAEIKNGRVVRSLRTPETNSRPIEIGTSLEQIHMPAAFEPQVIRGSDSEFHWWKIRDYIEGQGSDLGDWRTILEEMLERIPPEHRPKTRSSVNAIVGRAIGFEPKGGDVSRAYRHGIEAAQNRNNESIWVREILSNSRFDDYVLARARDRAADK